MKTNVLLTLALVVAVVVAGGCQSSKIKGADTWPGQIAGSYKSAIFTGETEFPGTTVFTVDEKGQLAGTYKLTEQDGTVVTGKLSNFKEAGPNQLTVVTGKLSNFKEAGPNQLKCKWVDKNGTGDFKLTFKKDLSSFEGSWNNTENSEQWHAWNGKK